MPSPPQQRVDSDQPTTTPPGRFSLHSLSAAFARLSGTATPPSASQEAADAPDESVTEPFGAVISPRMIVEGMLFVGNSAGQPVTNREIAAHIRDVSPQEVDELIAELNQAYRQQGTSYHIVSEGAGYRMELRGEFNALRERFRGRVRQAKLSPSAIEVLALVAYRQPISADEVTRLRGARSNAILSQLVRRDLIGLQRPKDAPRQTTYHTTDRFNRLFGIESPQDLPRSEDLDDN